MKITYSFMTYEDIPDVAELERQAFSQPWSEAGITGYMDAGHTMFVVASAEYTGEEPDAGSGALNATEAAQKISDRPSRKIVGYAAVFCVMDEGNLVSIVVDREYRRIGIAAELLDILYEKLSHKGIRLIHLEVRESNEAAINLYTNEGFVSNGRRKGFYDRPKEDALLFVKFI